MKIKNKNAQITIFVIIAIVLILGFILLLTSSNEPKEKTPVEVQEKTKTISFDTDFLKRNVDVCLSSQLKKALVISGMRGGFIYQRQGGVRENYLKTTNLKDLYPIDYLNKYSRNLDYLENVLIWEKDILANPEILKAKKDLVQSPKLSFNHTIKEDFENYITINFMDCIEDVLNTTEIKNKYQINYSKYKAEILSFDKNTKVMQLGNFDFKENDIIQLDINNTWFKTKIDKKGQIKIPNNLEIPTILEFITPINLNKTPKIEVNFLDETVEAKINYPILLKEKTKDIFFKETRVLTNVRFESLIKLAKNLMEKKKNFDKNISYLNLTEYQKVLNDTIIFERNIDLKISEELSDKKDNKKQIYSLIDHTSKIDGNSFILNFAYENSVPFLDETKITQIATEFNQTEKRILFKIGEDSSFYQDLSEIINDNEYIDKIPRSYINETTKEIETKPRHLHFKSFTSPDGKFTINEKGEITFTSTEQGIYSYDVTLTDSELQTTYNIQLITNELTNLNNKDAKNCLELIQGTNELKYPIDLDYYGLKEYDNNGKKEVYGFIVNSQADSSKLRLKSYCLPIGATVKSSGRTLSQNGNYYEIDLNQAGGNYEFEITETPSPVENYKVSIYSAGCLGPKSTTENPSCCNMNSLEETKNKIISNNNPGFTNNLLNGDKIDLGELYFCLDKENSGIDVKTNVLWNIKSDITSLYKGKVEFVCKGTYPILEDNQANIVSNANDFSGLTIKKIIKSEEEFTDIENILGTSVRLKKIQNLKECQFCNINIKNNLDFIMEYNNKELKFNTGRIYSETELSSLISELGNVENNNDEMELVYSQNKYKYLSKEGFYKYEDPNWNIFLSGFFGKGEQKYNKIGKYYCKSSDENQELKETEILDNNFCEDKYFNSQGNIESQNFNNNQECGTYTCTINNKQETCIKECKEKKCEETSKIKN